MKLEEQRLWKLFDSCSPRVVRYEEENVAEQELYIVSIASLCGSRWLRQLRNTRIDEQPQLSQFQPCPTLFCSILFSVPLSLSLPRSWPIYFWVVCSNDRVTFARIIRRNYDIILYKQKIETKFRKERIILIFDGKNGGKLQWRVWGKLWRLRIVCAEFPVSQSAVKKIKLWAKNWNFDEIQLGRSFLVIHSIDQDGGTISATEPVKMGCWSVWMRDKECSDHCRRLRVSFLY